MDLSLLPDALQRRILSLSLGMSAAAAGASPGEGLGSGEPAGAPHPPTPAIDPPIGEAQLLPRLSAGVSVVDVFIARDEVQVRPNTLRVLCRASTSWCMCFATFSFI